jgi:methylglutaconyl-CoA hydratase
LIAMNAAATGPVLLQVDDRGIARLVLNRPERNNAYDGALIAALLAALDRLEAANGLRGIVISGRGKHFAVRHS